MNKYLYILGLVGIALLSACSSDDLTTGFSLEDENALVAEAGRDSDVPITLGLVGGRSSGMTRTPIESDEDGVFTITKKYVGVFCLAREKQVDAPSFVSSTIDWETDNLVTWLKNVHAQINSYVEFKKFESGHAVAMDRYYPFGNWYCYDFYAYYPRVADISISAGSDGKKAYFATISITGIEDIIWGKASGADKSVTDDGGKTVNAYCSKYIRLNSGDVPEFKFEHKLTQLVFYVKPYDTAAAEEFYGEGTNEIKVTNLYLSNIDTKFDLCVASMSTDSENGYTPGKLNLPASRVQGNIRVYKIDGTDTNFTYTNTDAFSGSTTYALTNSEKSLTPQRIGYAMVAPLAANENYTVKVVLKDSRGTLYKSYTFTVKPPAEGFRAGKKYNIELRIKKK